MFAHRSYNVSPNIDDAGTGGGGGNIINFGMPIGSVIPFAGLITANGASGVPDKWLLCDGREVRIDLYQTLYNTIGYTYGVAPSIYNQTGIGAYTYNSNSISFNVTTANQFINIGTYIRPADFTVASGADLNGALILITSAPAIGGTGVGVGTFVQPVSGVGSGNATGSHYVIRSSIATPNMVSKFPLGASTNTSPSNSSTGGASTVVITADNLPQHTHQVYVPGNSALTSGSGQTVGFPNTTAVDATTVPSQTRLNNGTTLATNSAVNILNPYLALNYIIHAQN
jgi:microcystin-dependent protein